MQKRLAEMVGRDVGVDYGGSDGRMSKDLIDAQEGNVARDGKGGMKKAKQGLAFFTVDRDPASKRRDRHKDFQFYSVTKNPRL